jgi:hypothetical protein
MTMIAQIVTIKCVGRYRIHTDNTLQEHSSRIFNWNQVVYIQIAFVVVSSFCHVQTLVIFAGYAVLCVMPIHSRIRTLSARSVFALS